VAAMEEGFVFELSIAKCLYLRLSVPENRGGGLRHDLPPPLMSPPPAMARAAPFPPWPSVDSQTARTSNTVLMKVTKRAWAQPHSGGR
jgi:hypothetical protein